MACAKSLMKLLLLYAGQVAGKRGKRNPPSPCPFFLQLQFGAERGIFVRPPCCRFYQRTIIKFNGTPSFVHQMQPVEPPCFALLAEPAASLGLTSQTLLPLETLADCLCDQLVTVTISGQSLQVRTLATGTMRRMPASWWPCASCRTSPSRRG